MTPTRHRVLVAATLGIDLATSLLIHRSDFLELLILASGCSPSSLGLTMTLCRAATLIQIPCLAILGLYDPGGAVRPVVRVSACATATFSAGGLFALLGTISGATGVRVGPALVGLAGVAALTILLRWTMRSLAGRVALRPILIDGISPRARRLARALRLQAPCGVRAVAFAADGWRGERLEGLPVVGRDQARTIFADLPILSGLSPSPFPEAVPIPWDFGHDDSPLVLPDGTEIRPAETPSGGVSARLKRLEDLALGLAILPLVGAVILAAAAVLWLARHRPVFYRQVRLTKNHKPFKIIKLRSMRVGAESSGPVWPSRADERVTGIGNVLRRFWLDELPQLVNVIRGDLSFVGPRPERPQFAQEFARGLPKYRLRYRAPAGITGWAQVSGYIGNTSIRKRLAYDLAYIDRWSPWLDLCLICQTLYRILRRVRRPPNDYQPGRGSWIP